MTLDGVDMGLLMRLPQIVGRRFRDGGYFNVSTKQSSMTVVRYILKK